jgi:hypothetical protein
VSNPTGHPLFLQPFQTCIIVRKLLVKVVYGVAQVLWNRLLNSLTMEFVLHGYYSLPNILLDVKG